MSNPLLIGTLRIGLGLVAQRRPSFAPNTAFHLRHLVSAQSRQWLPLLIPPLGRFTWAALQETLISGRGSTFGRPAAPRRVAQIEVAVQTGGLMNTGSLRVLSPKAARYQNTLRR